MKLVTYLTPTGERRAGVVAGATVVDLAEGARAIGTELPSDVVGLLRLGKDGLAVADRVRTEAEAGRVAGMAADEVRLTAAVPNPPKVLLLAGNYQSHITEGGAPPVDKSRINPRPFIKPGTAVIGTNDPIVIPPDSDTLDYEIEIAAVIGTRGKQIPVERAEEYIAGYVVFNDVSARSLKIAEGRAEREGDWFFDWLLGKWCDGFAAVGPYLVTRDEAGSPGSLEMALRVNGELRQHSSAGEMIFSIPEAIAFISRFVTLEPGDLLAMGTPGGVGDTTQTYLKAGDVVDAEIERLGRLVNPVAGSG
ncbi:MAG TPA: fumarylacetoacetate hydrolase family protein [Thermomicrobiales bacterium]|nr:fumarylacetoacetate hydrolase family protein [Thermomicrobiales bacterium]